jgi:hypothetical protein
MAMAAAPLPELIDGEWIWVGVGVFLCDRTATE